MQTIRRILIVGALALALLPAAACDRVAPTCNAFVAAVTAKKKPKTVKVPKVKEAKRGGNGIIVVDTDPILADDDDDDCDDD